MKRFDIFVGGHLAVDMLPGLENYAPGTFLQKLKPGKLLYVNQASFSTGGPVSNTGLALHGLGLSVCILGKIGLDDFGRVIDRIFRSYSEDLVENSIDDARAQSMYKLLISNTEGTSYSICLSPPQTDRMFLHYPGANDSFSFDDIDFELVAESKIFHFGYPPLMRKMYIDGGSTLLRIYSEAKSCGVITSLDMALPDPNSPAGRADWKEILKKVLPYVDIFAPSFEEILYMLDREIYLEMLSGSENGDLISQITEDLLHNISNKLLDFGAKIVLIKLGDQGIYLRTSNPSSLEDLELDGKRVFSEWAGREIVSPCFEAEFKGALGAGDATLAGFLAAIVKEKTIHESIQLALGVGACCVEEMDPISGIPHWDDVCKRINLGWKKHKGFTLGPDWHFIDEFGQWMRID